MDDCGICIASLMPDPIAASVDDVLAAIAAAGTSGHQAISIWGHQVGQVGESRFKDALDEHDLRVDAVEAVMGWATGDTDAMRDEARAAINVAQAVGASIVGAASFEIDVDHDAATAGFSTLCQMLDEAGMKAALEFLPLTGIGTLAAAWKLVEAVDQPTAGILIDTWHWYRQRGGPDLDTLAKIPGERVTYVQLADVMPQPSGDIFVETMKERLVPGSGIVDFDALMAGLSAIGAEPVVSSEVFNTVAAADPLAHARAVQAGCRQVLIGSEE